MIRNLFVGFDPRCTTRFTRVHQRRSRKKPVRREDSDGKGKQLVPVCHHMVQTIEVLLFVQQAYEISPLTISPLHKHISVASQSKTPRAACTLRSIHNAYTRAREPFSECEQIRERQSGKKEQTKRDSLLHEERQTLSMPKDKLAFA